MAKAVSAGAHMCLHTCYASENEKAKEMERWRIITAAGQGDLTLLTAALRNICSSVLHCVVL